MGRGAAQTFSQRRHVDGQQVHEKIFNTLSHQGIKITMRYHLTSVRMTVIKKTTNDKVGGSLVAQLVKNLPAIQETWV